MKKGFFLYTSRPASGTLRLGFLKRSGRSLPLSRRHAGPPRRRNFTRKIKILRSLGRGFLFFCLLGLFSGAVFANTVTVKLYKVAKKGHGAAIGTITAKDTAHGLLLTPNLYGLTPGIHGFHLHQNPSCEDNGAAAGGHFDPNHTDHHLGPYSNHGHLGDLPALSVTKTGKVTLPVLVPRLTVAELQKRSFVIHAGGDNYSDNPALGGGGARVACGVIP